MYKLLIGIINRNDYLQSNDAKKVAVLMACESSNPQVITEYTQWLCQELDVDFKAVVGSDAEIYRRNTQYHIEKGTFKKKLRRVSFFNGFYHGSVIASENRTLFKKKGDKDFFILFEYVSEFGYSLIACDAENARKIFGKIIYAERPIFDAELEMD